ncbi:hypothetical protein M139_2034 [Bacteroides fragilis str. S23L24]|nr:hypothetical protein M139_2034 [Bacteroides fragilis str. S23L24]
MKSVVKQLSGFRLFPALVLLSYKYSLFSHSLFHFRIEHRVIISV